MKLQEYFEEKTKLFKTDPEQAFQDVIKQMQQAYRKVAELDKNNRKKLYDLFTLFNIGKEISSSLDIQAIIQNVILTSRAQMRAKKVHLFLRSSEDENLLLLTSSTALKSAQEKQEICFEEKDPFILFFEEHKKPSLLKDVPQDAIKNKIKPSLDKLDSPVYVPLMAKERLIGLLVLGEKMKDEYTEDNLNFLSVLANFTAAAVENARLYNKVQHNLSLISGLYEISGIMNSAISLEEILKMVVETITTGFGAEISAIMLLNKLTDEFVIKTHSGLSPDTVKNYRLKADKDLIEGFKEPVFIEKVEENREVQEYFFQTDKDRISYCLSVPLRAGERLVGFLNIYKFKDMALKPDKIEEKKSIFSIIASQIAPALLMAKMIEETKEKIENPFFAVKDALGNEIIRVKEFNMGFVVLSILFKDLSGYLKKENLQDLDDFFMNLETLLRLNFRDQDRILRMDFNKYLVILPLTLKNDAEEMVRNIDFRNFDSVKSLMDIRMIAFPDEAKDMNELLALI